MYSESLVPRVSGGPMQKMYTVMAKLYLDWVKELRTRKEMVNGMNKNRLDFI
jgi:hypothetical protein